MRTQDSKPAFSSLLLAALAAGACEAPAASSPHYSLAGVAQKGPFVLGSQVEVAELDSTLAPTGRNFTTKIANDTGAFSLPNVALTSPYVSLTASGFFFDEVAGMLSAAQIQLEAIADVSNLSTVNANLLSHMERDRVLKLIGEGKSLGDAKKQAQKELLAIFGIESDIAPAETLNIANGSADDTALLAVSVITQSRRTPAELTELLSQLSADFAPDGTLDTSSLGVKLAVGAEWVNLHDVRANLIARYNQLGTPASIGDFESVVRHFIATSPFVPAASISYPETGKGGPNVLASTVTTLPFTSPFTFSLAANVPIGKTVRVHIQASGGVYLASGSDPAHWVVQGDSEQTVDFTAEASEMAGLRDASVGGVVQSGTTRAALAIDLYENGATSPTSSKTIQFL